MAKNSDDDPIRETDRITFRTARDGPSGNDLKPNASFFGAIFDGVSDEVMIVDSGFNIRDVNRAFLDRYHLKKDDVLGSKCYQVKEHANGPCSLQDRGCPLEQARSYGQRVEMIHRHRSAEDDARDFMLTMYPVSLGEQGFDYFVEIAKEVTDYQGLIRKLKGSEERFRAILNTATSAILSFNDNYEIVLFNNAAQRIFGYSRREILGRPLSCLLPARYRNREGLFRRIFDRNEPHAVGKTLSAAACRKNGETFPIELSFSVMELEGMKTFTAFIRDVSEKQFLEKKLLQSERLAAVGQAVAHVAHEIKNPLMIIGGFSSQMKKGLSSEKDINKLDMILEEVGRLERLVAGLGDFTKTYSLVRRMTDINEVIRDVVKIMAEVYPADMYGFYGRLSQDVQEINCDPDKIKQVFINVISNGFEAMVEGGHITVATDNIPSGVEIRISDEGVGIPEEDLHHIFEPFYTTRKRGSGLGLAISYKIVEAHNGDISAVSHPGQGTTFVIRLPTH